MRILNKILFVLFAFAVLASCSSTNTVKKPIGIDYDKGAAMIDAVTALNNDELDKSENLLLEILNKDKDKDNATAMYYLSNIYFQKQDIAKSLNYAKSCINVDKKNIWYKLQYAQINIALQKYEDAADIFEDIVYQHPDVIEYHQQLVSLYHVMNSTDKEIAALDRMENRFGVSEMVSMQKYNIYKSKGDMRKAENEIEKLSKAFPTQTEYLSMIAEIKMKNKDYDGAFKYYNKVKEQNPNDEYLNLTFANYYLVKHNEDSLYYYLKKAASQEDIDFKTKTNIVYTVYQDSVDTDSLTFERFFSLLETMRLTKDSAECQLWSMLNLGYMRKSLYKEGVYSARKAIDLGCVNFQIYTNLLFASNTFESADSMITLSNEAIETYPEQPLGYLFKAVSLERNEKWQDALDVLTSGLDKVGNNKAMKEDFYMNMGDCCHALDKKEDCYKYYDEVLILNPNNYSVLNNYAYYLSLDGKDLDKALNMAKQVVEKYPDNATFVDTYAWVLYVKGDYREAKAAMDKVTSSRSQWSKEQESHYKEILNKIEN